MPAPTSQPLLVLLLETVIDARVTVLVMVRLSLPTQPPPALPGAFEAAKNWGADALIVLSNPLSLAHRVRIGELAAKADLPTIYLYRAHVSAGGLISYGP